MNASVDWIIRRFNFRLTKYNFFFDNTICEIYGCVFVAEGAAVPEHCDKRERESWIGGNKLRLSTCDSYNHSTLTHVGGNGCFFIHLIDKNMNNDYYAY